MKLNPSLAVDADPEYMTFPAIGQPKVDGVRGCQMEEGKFTARSLKAFKNKVLTRYWSNPVYYGLDGELVAPGLAWTDPTLCRLTTSITGTIESDHVPHLIGFDYVTGRTYDLPYARRYKELEKRVQLLQLDYDAELSIMPFVVLKNMDEVERYHARNVRKGYEGTIVRNPRASFKPDRSTKNMELWRITDRITFEVRVIKLIEAMRNDNEAKTNALGRTERSSHKANKTGKAMVGMVQGEVLKDVVWQGKTLFPKGMLIDIGPGEMDHPTRKRYWENPKLVVGKIGKVSVKPYGTMEKARQPVWLTLRNKEDLV